MHLHLNKSVPEMSSLFLVHTHTLTSIPAASLSPSPQRQWRQMRERAWDQGWFKITRLWHKVQWGTHGDILPHDPYTPGVVSLNGKA